MGVEVPQAAETPVRQCCPGGMLNKSGSLDEGNESLKTQGRAQRMVWGTTGRCLFRAIAEKAHSGVPELPGLRNLVSHLDCRSSRRLTSDLPRFSGIAGLPKNLQNRLCAFWEAKMTKAARAIRS